MLIKDPVNAYSIVALYFFFILKPSITLSVSGWLYKAFIRLQLIEIQAGKKWKTCKGRKFHPRNINPIA